MAIELNLEALNVYRNAGFADANTIINNDGVGIKANGVYKGALSALSRSSEEKTANNAVRTELLKALGRAFNVKGMTEADGKVVIRAGKGEYKDFCLDNYVGFRNGHDRRRN